MSLRDLGLAIFLAAFSVGAAAATPAPAAASSSTQPSSAPAPTDVQTFGDWTVRCFPVKAAAPCDMLQVAMNKDTKQRVVSISLAYVPSQDAYATQILVPLGVALQKGVTVSNGVQKIEGIKFRRCQNDGCYVETVLKKNSVEGLAAGNGKGSISVVPYPQTTAVDLPMSFNGFGQALARLKDLARAKATTPAPTPAQPAAAPAPKH